MKKLLAMVLALCLLWAVPAMADHGAADVVMEGNTYHLTLTSIGIEDGQLSVVLEGFGSTLRMGSTGPMVAATPEAHYGDEIVHFTTVQINVGGPFQFTFERSDLPDEVWLNPYDPGEEKVLIWQAGDPAGDPAGGAEGASIPAELVGEWRGVGTPKNGGPSIDLDVAINADGSGEYTFDQGGYHESYPFTLSNDDSSFSVDIPATSQLGSVTGTWALEGGVLKLDITSTFTGGGSYSYTAECEKVGEEAEAEPEPAEAADPAPADEGEASGEAPAEIEGFDVGDTVTFGRMEQDGSEDNGPEPIEWIVLAADGDARMLISKYGLIAMAYNEGGGDATWETCSVRAWLNGEFYEEAFTAEEQGRIRETRVVNADNEVYGTDGGNDTDDMVFLLSIDELNRYFPDQDDRITVPTAYALDNGAYTSSSNGKCWWRLRSPGQDQGYAAVVNSTGFSGGVYPDLEKKYMGETVGTADDSIRPVLWMNPAGLAASAPEGAPEPEADEAPETREEPAEEPAGEVTTAEVLDALGEGPYREVYDALSAGEVIQKGSKGDIAKGVQQTLIAFGQDIAADGSVGPKTIGALNAVQAAFGLEQTEALDAAGYEQLLPRLLVAVDEDRARELLADSMGEEFDYMRGCVLFAQQKFFSAKRAFEDSGCGDWEARVEACAQPWPKTGQLYKNSAVKGSATDLTVQFNSDPDVAMLVKIYTTDDVLARTLFIGGTGKAKTSLPKGTYIIKDGTGRTWYGDEEAFGSDGYYEIMTFGDGEEEVTLKSGHAYTITVNVQDPDPNADSVGSEYENWNNF